MKNKCICNRNTPSLHFSYDMEDIFKLNDIYQFEIIENEVYRVYYTLNLINEDQTTDSYLEYISFIKPDFEYYFTYINTWRNEQLEKIGV